MVDYITQYSGIHPGDLDPTLSTKHLTTLKNSYSKLLWLELTGVKFVGHGLSKDFRVINMQPVPAQVIDTVDIFYMRLTRLSIVSSRGLLFTLFIFTFCFGSHSNSRKISLRFLAWHVLGIEMQQSDHGHDSVEDALTALKVSIGRT